MPLPLVARIALAQIGFFPPDRQNLHGSAFRLVERITKSPAFDRCHAWSDIAHNARAFMAS